MIIRPLAESDITDASVWYERRQEGLGLAFLDEIDHALAAMVENPGRFAVLRRRPEVRRVLVSRFPYRIFFIRERQRLVVFRVLHQAQHDRNWTAHLP